LLAQICVYWQLPCDGYRFRNVVNIAVSLANFAVVDSVKDDRSGVYIRYNSGPRTLLCGTPDLTEKSSVYSDSNITRKCQLCK
jgi:hypothetical protein